MYLSCAASGSTGSSPAAPTRSAPRAAAGIGPKPELPYLTEAELEGRERENLLVILKNTNWKIKGPNGAAELLGVKPTTLFSRMKKMGIRPPD